MMVVVVVVVASGIVVRRCEPNANVATVDYYWCIGFLHMHHEFITHADFVLEHSPEHFVAAVIKPVTSQLLNLNVSIFKT